MKLKKLLALVLAVIMCASLFTVVPTTVSAAGASEWQNFYSEADGGFRDTRPDSDATPPEGYERIGVTKDAKSTQVTKEKYDLTETTFVLRDLYFSQTGSDWANIVFANDQITGKRQTKTNESNGTLSMFVRKTDSGIKFTVYTSSGGEEAIATIADATEFEIGLVKLTATDGSSVYRLRVNNTYSSSTKTSNIYTIVNTFGANSIGSYVSVSANGNMVSFRASAKFQKNDETTNRWVARAGKLYTADNVAVTDNAATSLRAKDGNSITSLSRYDMTENDFTISNAKVSTTNYSNNGYRTKFVFGKYREDNNNVFSNNCMSSADRVQIFVRPNVEEIDGVKTTTKLIVSLSTNVKNDVYVPAADDYKFSFRLENDKYQMYINETKITTTGSDAYFSTFATAVNNFCTTGSGTNCYITISTNTYFSGDYKVSIKPELVDDSLWKTFYKRSEGGVRAEIPADDTAAPEGYERIAVNSSDKSTLVTKEKYDLTETTFVLTDLYFSNTGSDWVNIVFANDQTTGKRQTKTDAANGTLSMFVRKRSDGVEFTVYTNAGGEISLGKFTSANEYEIGFVKIYTDKDEYRWRLRVNNVYSSTTTTSEIYTIVNTFGPNSTGSYISISANSAMTSFRASCKLLNNDDTNSRWVARSGKLYAADGTSVSNNAATSLKVSSSSTVSSLSRYNMLEDTFVISNSEFYTRTASSSRVTLIIAANREANLKTTKGTSMSSETKIKLIFKQFKQDIDGDGVEEMTHLQISLSTNIANNVLVPVDNEYRFRFRKVGDVYRLFINDVQIGNDGSTIDYVKTFASAVKNFCTTANAEKCYITLMAEDSAYWAGDFKVIKNSEFIANIDEPMYSCLDFEDFTVENGAVINGETYNSGDTFSTAGIHEIIYPENGIRIKRTLALYHMGDLNSDNTINVLDYIAMTKALAQNYELSAAGEKAADLTEDKELHANDLVALRKKILGIDEFFDTTTDTVGNISAVFPKNNQIVKIANDNVYYWYQNFVSRNSHPYYGLGDIFAGKPVEFKWTADGSASSYVLKISTNKSFEDAIEIVTTTNSAAVNSLFAGKTYYWQVTADDAASSVYSFKTAVSPRTISIEGLSNSRDLGGYMTDSGKRVKQGMVYRSANLNSVTEAGKDTAINVYKFKTDLDLRNAGEEGAGSGSPLGINYINAPGAYYAAGDHGINVSGNYPKIVAEIEAFANADNYPIVVHCAVGRDRTGTISMLINGLLGVSKEDLYMDYELSFFSEKGSGDDPGIDHMVNQFEKMYNWIVDNYGGTEVPFSTCVENYMFAIGVSQDSIDAIRGIMLEQ